MNDRIRLVRFIKIYAIYEGILETSTNKIVDQYEKYVLQYPEMSNIDEIEFSQMKTFILSKQWNN